MQIAQRKVTDIVTNGNVRGIITLDDAFIKSIEDDGILQPLVVRTIDGVEVLIAGHRRLAAAQQLGIKTVDVVFEDGDITEVDRIRQQISENLRRDDLTDWDLAQAAFDLKALGLKQGEVAEQMGIKKELVSQFQKAAKPILNDENFTGEGLEQLDLANLLAVAESASPSDVVHAVIGGESMWQATRRIDHELAVVAFYDDITPDLKAWSEKGILVNTDDPRTYVNKGGDTTVDKKVAHIKTGLGFGSGQRELEVKVKDHIKLDCHRIWVHEGVSGFGGFQDPTIFHFCMNAGLHALAGKAELKASNAEELESQRVGRSKDAHALRDAKLTRAIQAQKYMASKVADSFLEQQARWLALDTLRSDDYKTFTRILDVANERQKGAPYGWHEERVTQYMDEAGLKGIDRELFLLRLKSVSAYVERGVSDYSNGSAAIAERLAKIKVTLDS